MPVRKKNIIIGLTLLTLALLVFVVAPAFFPWLSIRIPLAGQTERVVGGRLSANSLPIGNHTLEFRGLTTTGQQVSEAVSFVVDGGGGGGSPSSYTFDTYISETPISILAASHDYGPITAQYDINVSTHTSPPATLFAKASYQYDAPGSDGRWVLSNIQTTGGGEAPEITSHNESVASQIALSASQRYRATVTIDGTLTEGNVAPALLPRFRNTPWVGHKKILVVKGRYDDEPIPNKADAQANAPYGPNDQHVKEVMDSVKRGYENQSNGKVTIEYEIRDASFSPEGIPVREQSRAAGVCPASRIADRLLNDLGITPENKNDRYDMIVISMYQDSVERMNQEFECRLDGGSGLPYGSCPSCTLGAWMHLADPTVLPHEIGHGLSFGHTNAPGRCEGETLDYRQPLLEQLFGTPTRGSNCIQQNSINGHVMSGVGWPSIYYHALDRASVGWLGNNQVELITESGIYDLYSERDDYTANPDDPVVLQLPVTVSSVYSDWADYVYLTLINQGSLSDYGRGLAPKNISAALEGVHLTAATGLVKLSTGENISNRSAVLKQGGSIAYYWYGEDDTGSSIPIGERLKLNWENTNVNIEVVSVTREADRTHAKVKVEMNGAPAPATTPPLPAPVALTSGPVSTQPTLRWQPVSGAVGYHVRLYHLFEGLKSGFDIKVQGPSTDLVLPGSLHNVAHNSNDYSWNVQAIDAVGNGGKWSSLQPLDVE